MISVLQKTQEQRVLGIPVKRSDDSFDRFASRSAIISGFPVSSPRTVLPIFSLCSADNFFPFELAPKSRIKDSLFSLYSTFRRVLADFFMLAFHWSENGGLFLPEYVSDSFARRNA